MKSIQLLSILAIIFSVIIFQSCEGDVDPCDAIVCLNDGTCNDGTCACPTGYSGTLCGTHCSASVVGTYTISSAEDASCTQTGSVVISQGSDDQSVNIIYTDNFGPFPTYTGTLSSDCSSITIDSVPSGGGFDTLVEGSATINGDIITLTLTWSNDSCTFTASK